MLALSVCGGLYPFSDRKVHEILTNSSPYAMFSGNIAELALKKVNQERKSSGNIVFSKNKSSKSHPHIIKVENTLKFFYIKYVRKKKLE